MPAPKNTKTTRPAASRSSRATAAEPARPASGPGTATATAAPPRPRRAASIPAAARTAPPTGTAASARAANHAADAGQAAPGAGQPSGAHTDARRDARKQRADRFAEFADLLASPATTPPPPGTAGPGAPPAAPQAAPPAAVPAAPEEASPVRAAQDAAAGHAAQIREAAAAVSTALQDGDLSAALAGIEEIRDQAGNARRILRAAAGSRRAGGTATHPGGLREKAAAHLRDHPGKEFTPHEIGKVIGHSSGAIANALDTLVRLGSAELSTEKPRRFRHLTTAEGKGDGGAAAPGTA